MAQADGDFFGNHSPVPLPNSESDQEMDSEPEVRPPETGELSLKANFFNFKTLGGFALSIAILVFFALTVKFDFSEIIAHIESANLFYLALALFVYFGIFYIRAIRWQVLLNQTDQEDIIRPRKPGLVNILMLSWFVNCILPARIGDVYRAYMLKQKNRINFSFSLGTILGERAGEVLVLFMMMAIFGWLAFSMVPSEAGLMQTVLLVGFVASVAIVVSLAVLRFWGGYFEKFVPHRFHSIYNHLRFGINTTSQKQTWLRFYTCTLLIWLGEGTRLLLVVSSLHITGLGFPAIMYAALAGSLLSAIPFTPAGLGAVEGSLVLILGLFGLDRNLATSLVILDRLVSYWSNIFVGFGLYLFNLKVRPQFIPEKTSRLPIGK